MSAPYVAPSWDEGAEEKIPIDELFEGAYRADDARMATYNKVLARAHRTIRMTNRARRHDQYCFFKFPEVLVGCPMYDKNACVEFVLEKLNGEGFRAVFVHPSMLVISWKHWIDPRKRAEIYARTGLKVDGLGNVKSKKQGERNRMLEPVTFGSALMAMGRDDAGVAQHAAPGTAALAPFGSQQQVPPVEEFKPLGIYEGLGLRSRLA